MNVPYRYNENGTALLVPADRVYDARLHWHRRACRAAVRSASS